MPPLLYRETFDEGPGGWFGWTSNAAGPRPLEAGNSSIVSRSPWWIDYNHAPPGAGYLHLLAILLTRGPLGEHVREVGGENRFIAERFGHNFTSARLSVRWRGELLERGASVRVLVQSVKNGICGGWLLTGQTLTVTPAWSDQCVLLGPDAAQWTELGSRHDRTDYYGHVPLADVLADVNTNILLVLHPLDVAPMGPLAGDPHRLRPERDYPVWRSRLPEGYVEIDEVRIEFAETTP